MQREQITNSNIKAEQAKANRAKIPPYRDRVSFMVSKQLFSGFPLFTLENL